MPSQQQQKLDARNAIYDAIGVRYSERWRTEAEDKIVNLVQALTWEMSGRELRQMAELMGWVKVHLAGESRSSLMAACEAKGSD